MAVSKFLDPKNDVAFRKIFGSEKNKDILIHFINDIMGFEDANQIQEVTFLSPVQNPEIAYKKESVVDVLLASVDVLFLSFEVLALFVSIITLLALSLDSTSLSSSLSSTLCPSDLLISLNIFL